MADALGVDISKRAKELVGVQLDFENGHGSLHLVEKARGAIDGLGNIFEHQVEVNLVLLERQIDISDLWFP